MVFWLRLAILGKNGFLGKENARRFGTNLRAERTLIDWVDFDATGLDYILATVSDPVQEQDSVLSPLSPGPGMFLSTEESVEVESEGVGRIIVVGKTVVVEVNLSVTIQLVEQYHSFCPVQLSGEGQLDPEHSQVDDLGN